jgi:hypothetical protein
MAVFTSFLKIQILKKYISLSKQENIYEAIYRGVAVGNVKSILDALNKSKDIARLVVQIHKKVLLILIFS